MWTIIREYYCVIFFLSWSFLTDARMEFAISKTWDNKPVDHESIVIKLYPDGEFTSMEIKAPFFNDPPAPDGESGKPFPKLWDYEVVEAFFLGKEEKYLEVEFSPHGQHLLLLLSGRKNAIKMCLPVNYTASINGNTWRGITKIPKAYFPPSVNLFNAYAIHGSGDDRTYEALFPTQTEHFEYPDFHRLEFFRHIDFEKISNQGVESRDALSQVWITALQEKENGSELSCDLSLGL